MSPTLFDCLRWRDRAQRFRPAGEPIDPGRYEVAAIPDDATAAAFVAAHHYSGTYVAARLRVGLYRAGHLVGVAVFSQPATPGTLTNVFDQLPAVELGRFVLLDDVPGNGETWFLARAFRLAIAAGFRGVLSFSDPVPRQDAGGRLIFPGHLGTIYQAHNARYLGRGTPRTLRVLPDGSVFNENAWSKARRGVKGWRYACRRLEHFGAPPPPQDDAGRRAWVGEWVRRLTRPRRHRGNHRYGWWLGGPAAAGHSLPYPKSRDHADA